MIERIRTFKQVIIRSRKKVTKGLESQDATVKLTSLKTDDILEKLELLGGIKIVHLR